VAVYLFTFHAYRSWMPDRPQGYVRRGSGPLPPDPEMAGHYARGARSGEVIFDDRTQNVLVAATREICTEKGWLLYQVRATPTHLHALVGWRAFAGWTDVKNTMKRRLGAALSKALDRKGPWFSRGASRKRVRDRRHFDYLMHEYLPRHAGRYWREDQAEDGASG
jgi:hypothetical protein